MLAAELLLLLPLDETVAGVLPDEGHKRHMLPHRCFQLLTVHHESAVAADRQHLLLRIEKFCRERTRDGEAHAGEAVGDEAGVGLIAVVVAGDPHLMGAHIADHDVVAAHDLTDIGEDACRLHGAAVVRRHCLMLCHHRLAESQCKFRLTGAVGAAQYLIQTF